MTTKLTGAQVSRVTPDQLITYTSTVETVFGNGCVEYEQVVRLCRSNGRGGCNVLVCRRRRPVAARDAADRLTECDWRRAARARRPSNPADDLHTAPWGDFPSTQ